MIVVTVVSLMTVLTVVTIVTVVTVGTFLRLLHTKNFFIFTKKSPQNLGSKKTFFTKSFFKNLLFVTKLKTQNVTKLRNLNVTIQKTQNSNYDS